MKIFDAHCDTLSVLVNNNASITNSCGMIRSDMLDSYEGYIQTFAAWLSPDCSNPLRQALILADKFFAEAQAGGFTVIEDRLSLQRVVSQCDKGAILSIENGNALCGSCEVLNMLYRVGFRAITLTWNGSNELGFGAVDSVAGGLTDFGKSVVKRMNELGMVIDVSHLSEKGFWDVEKLSTKPFMASHSNAAALCNHPRNLNDAQIKAVIEKRGVIGINLYPLFLTGTDKADISDVIRHIEHILSLGGEDSLGIGTDFDGISCTPSGLEDVSCLYKIFDEMAKLGYGDSLIQKISYQNFVRLFSQCLKYT